MLILCILFTILTVGHFIAELILICMDKPPQWVHRVGEPDNLSPLLLLLVSLYNYTFTCPWYCKTHNILFFYIAVEYFLLVVACLRHRKTSDTPPGRHLAGALIGTAVGDSMGLPYERLSRSTINYLLTYPLRQNLFSRYGTISDDTEQTVLVTASLYRNPQGDIKAFLNDFARAYRRWIIWNPWASGRASLLAGAKLIFRCPPEKSGIASAGNAPAMRSAVIGICYADDPDTRRRFVTAATQITHTDIRADIGAQAIAALAAYSTMRASGGERLSIDELISLLKAEGPDEPEWLDRLVRLEKACLLNMSTTDYVNGEGESSGISGYIYSTVLTAVFIWFNNWGNYALAIEEAIRCGGDTDTVAAIAGALTGIQVGEEKIPKEWIKRIRAYPYSIAYLRYMAGSNRTRFRLWLSHLRLIAILLLVTVLLWNVVKRCFIALILWRKG